MAATLNAKPRRKPDTLADVLRDLGDIPPDRVLWEPYPGTATEEDMLRHKCVELVDGILIRKSLSFVKSTSVVGFLGLLFDGIPELRKIGAALSAGPFRLVPGVIRTPEIGYSPWKRILTADGKIPDIIRCAPDLVVDFPMQNNPPRELKRKYREYFRGGTKLLWEVDLETRTVTEYQSPKEKRVFTIHDTLDGGKVLPGFSLKLFDFFNSPQVTLIPPN